MMHIQIYLNDTLLLDNIGDLLEADCLLNMFLVF